MAEQRLPLGVDAVLRAFSLYDLRNLIRILQRKALRVTCLALALPIAWVGRELLPAELPSQGVLELIAGDLGAVAAGIFLSFLGVLLAACYGLGTLGAVAMDWTKLRLSQSAGMVASVIALLALTLYICGRAFSWGGLLWMLLATGGTIWGGSQFWPKGNPDLSRAVIYDPEQD